jgi:hypothetical protein
VVLQIVASTKLFAVAAAIAVQTFPITAGYLMNRFLVALAVIWRRKPFGARTGCEPAVMNLEVFLLMLPVGSLKSVLIKNTNFQSLATPWAHTLIVRGSWL